jgi:hypothetical protein
VDKPFYDNFEIYRHGYMEIWIECMAKGWSAQDARDYAEMEMRERYHKIVATRKHEAQQEEAKTPNSDSCRITGSQFACPPDIIAPMVSEDGEPEAILCEVVRVARKGRS